MSRKTFHGYDPGLLRELLKDVSGAAQMYREAEENLVKKLYFADHNRLYLWLGYKSLSGYCVQALKLGRTQTQRLITLVRRIEPTVNLEQLVSKYDERANKLDPLFEESRKASSNQFEKSAITGKSLF